MQEAAGNEQLLGGNDEGMAVQSLDGLGGLEASRFQFAEESSGPEARADWQHSHEAHHWTVVAQWILRTGHLPAWAAAFSEDKV